MISNGNGTPKIIDFLVLPYKTISGYYELELYYAEQGDYTKAAMYRDHQIKRIKNTIT